MSKAENLDKHINILKHGTTSSATSSSVTLPFLFIKYIINFKNFHVYEREKHIASILKNFEWYPKLIHSDDINQILIFRNVGNPLTVKNKPLDIKEQFEKIIFDMKSVNVQHNDIKHGELLIDENNKIYLCDFGWGSINNQLGCNIGI